MDVSIREFLEARIGALEIRIDERTALLRAQNEKDKETLNERLATMNEFRDQLREQSGTFATREIVEERFTSNRSLIEKIERELARMDGSVQSNRMWIAAVGVLVVVIQLVLEIVHHG